jgi:dTDP-4-amino-4,6-dideoxygalactose transaminase
MDDTLVIKQFEYEVAKYAGAKYGVSISSCTNAIFLSLQYLLSIGELEPGQTITIPSHTFLSVPCQLKLCSFKIKFEDKPWSGIYQLEPTRVFDCATRFTEDMFVGGNNLQCLSFQYRKHIKIGRGGMVITNDFDAVKWLRMARINGRHEGVSQADEELEFCGWNMYFTPEQAARGLSLLEALPKGKHPDCGSSETYPDISKQKVFK